MDKPLRVLILEDSLDDAELMLRELRQAGIELEWLRVESENEFGAHLDDGWDLILSDYTLPGWDAPAALHLLQQRALDIPFIVLSGVMDESIAVHCIKQGAADYLLKDRMARLSVAVQRALEEREVRRDKQRAEAALRHLEIYQNNIVQALTEGIIVQDASGYVTFANPAAAAILGYTPDDLIGVHWTVFVAPDHHTIVRAADERRARGIADRYELEIIRPNGQRLPIAISGLPQFEEERFIGTLAVFSDIAERRRAERNLRESEERFRLAFENSKTGMALVDLEGRFTRVNRQLCEMFGYPEAEMIEKHFNEFSHADDRDIGLTFLRSAVSGELGGGDFEKRYIRKDGQIVLGHVSVSLVRGDRGEPLYFVSQIRDITQERRTEDAERAQRVLAEALRDTAAAINSTLDVDEVLERVLANVGRVVEYEAASVVLIEAGVGHLVREIGRDQYMRNSASAPLEVSLDHFPIWRQMYETGQPYISSDVTQDPNWIFSYDRRWVRSYLGAPILLKEGEVIGFIRLKSSIPGFYTAQHAEWLLAFTNQAAVAIRNARLFREIQNHNDYLERAVAERTEQLSQAKERVEVILNSSSDIILLLKQDGAIEQANRVFYATFGLEPDTYVGQPVTVLTGSDDAWALLEALHTAVNTNHSQRLEITVSFRDSPPFEADVALSPVVQGSAQFSGVVCSLRDISVRKRAEKALKALLEREIELNALKSRFIATASHEFRTPMAVIRMAIDLLERYNTRLSDEQKHLEFDRIRASIIHMVSLLEDVMAVDNAQTSGVTFTPEPMELEPFCRDLVAEYQSTMGIEHRFAMAYAGTCDGVWLDPKLLRQILGNLFSNAIKYSPVGTYIQFDVTCQPKAVTFVVRDHGIGIPQGDFPRLFEPFHRAENVGAISGTGLGLAIIKQSVEAHGGSITFDSVEGEGTRFTVTLLNALPEE